MKHWIHTLASLKISVGLVSALLVALAAGTMVESSQGTEAAGRLVYYAPWFRLLLAFLAVNTLAALIDKWPPTKHRIGFYLTHTAMLLILVGALTSELAKTEGQLALWEGQQSPIFVDAGGEQHQLPYTVRLDAFEIDTYPGTMRPAMFRSRVTVTDPRVGSFPAVIEMNKELTWGGYKLFQSSYQQTGGREMSILSVSHDPGKNIVFLGYFLLMGGMATVIGTRMVQARARARFEAEQAAAEEERARTRKAKGKRSAKAAALVLPLLLASALAGFTGTAGAATASGQEVGISAPVPDAAQVAALRRMPVQHDGRVMPLDTLAREMVWQVTGSEHGYGGLDPVTLALGWSFHSDAWSNEPVVKVGSDELAVLAGLPAGTRHASFRRLAGSQPLLDLFAQARGKQDREEPMSRLEKDAGKLEGRLLWMRSLLTRDALRAVPATAPPGSGGPRDAWAPLPTTVATVADLVTWYEQQRANPPPEYPAFSDLEREIDYNRVQPSRLAWWILLPAMLVSLGALRWKSRLLDLLATAALVGGFAVMTWGIATRWAVAGRIPASNMYESMLFLAWGIGLFALVAAAVLRNRLVIFNAAAMAALTMLLVDLLPIDPFIHPMAPVLSGTPWLAIHVPIIMVSYSVLALGVLIAHLQIGTQIFRPARRDTVARLNDLLYWYMHVGSLLLVAGIITGSIWAASSWGRYWGWDPKEVWSLIAFLAYMAILHSRFDKQIGPFGVAAASIVAFWAVLMTYLGVNFILASGLHSYGFGSGGLVGWMSGIGALELVFLGAGYVAHRRARAEHGPLKTAVT